VWGFEHGLLHVIVALCSIFQQELAPFSLNETPMSFGTWNFEVGQYRYFIYIHKIIMSFKCSKGKYTHGPQEALESPCDSKPCSQKADHSSTPMNENYKPCVQHKYGSQCINGKRLKVSCGRIVPPSQRYGIYKQYGTNNDTALFNNLHNLREFCNRIKPHVFKM